MNDPKKILRLESGFFEFTDSLTLIRDEAIYRMISPDALLFSLLARISAAIPPAFALPAFVGSHSTPSLCIAVVGRAGIGKSQANAAARELFPMSNEMYGFDLPNGTGQGMIESYLRPARKGEAGYEEGVKIRKRLGCHFYIDEGSNLVSLAKKSEDITLDTIRSLWSGQPVGQTNASISTSRFLEARSAAFGLAVGFQPDIAAQFIHSGNEVGTPQRFLWCLADNPEQPDTAPKPNGILRIEQLAHREEHFEFKFSPEIQREAREQRGAAMRGELIVNDLERHDFLKQMKVAVCLAVLENETSVDLARWALAGNIVEVSRNVLHNIREEYAEKELAQQAKKNDQSAEKTIRVNEKTREQATKAGAATMARKLHKEMRVLLSSDLSQAVSGKDKHTSTKEEMIDYAIREHWIVEVIDKGRTLYKAGKIPPPASTTS